MKWTLRLLPFFAVATLGCGCTGMLLTSSGRMIRLEELEDLRAVQQRHAAAMETLLKEVEALRVQLLEAQQQMQTTLKAANRLLTVPEATPKPRGRGGRG